MADVIAKYSLSKRIGVLFSGELGGVDAQDHQLLRVSFFQLPQLRKNVHAVDSAERPEIQKDQLTLQVAHLDRRLRVQPVKALWKLRCMDHALLGQNILPDQL